MIKEMTMYTVSCDEPDCGATTDDGGDYTCWESESSAWEVAEDSAGIFGGDDWLLMRPVAWCPSHRPRCSKCATAWLDGDDLPSGLCEDCAEAATKVVESEPPQSNRTTVGDQ